MQVVEADKALCDRDTQPFPHWGVKGGQCLKSCGGLAGPNAQSFDAGEMCSRHGMVNAGIAYDVPVCCM